LSKDPQQREKLNFDIYVDPHQGGARFYLHYGDLTDATNLIRLLQNIRPDEIYTSRRRATCR